MLSERLLGSLLRRLGPRFGLPPPVYLKPTRQQLGEGRT